MVRDNWQTRVENANARRQESKQRKQRVEEKRQCKSRVQELLLQLLDVYFASYYLAASSRDNNNNNNSKNKEEQLKEITGERREKSNNKQQQQQNNKNSILSDDSTLHIWSEAADVVVTKNAILDVLSTVGNGGGGSGAAPKRKTRSSSAGNIAEGGGGGGVVGGGGAFCWSGSLLGSADAAGPTVDEIAAEGAGGTTPSPPFSTSSRIEGTRRDRSKSFGGSGKNKKVHPRSKEQQQQQQEQQQAVTFNADYYFTQAKKKNTTADGPWLCKKDFFHGKCPGNNSSSSSGSSCRHVHYSTLSSSASFLSSCLTGNASLVTLESVLLRNNKPKNQSTTTAAAVSQEHIQTQLQQSEMAAAASAMKDNEGASSGTAMDLLCHSAIDLSELVSPKSSSSSSSLSELVMTTLASAEYQIPLSSIVYVVLHGTLVFDRHRNGILTMPGDGSNNNMAQEEQPYYSSSKPRNRRTSSIGSEYDTSTTTTTPASKVGGDSSSSDAVVVAVAAGDLPGPILEHMLTFLPDTAVAACAQTCRAWYHEIGQRSPNLWRHLLKRRNWPVPPVSPAATSADNNDDEEEDEEEDDNDENENEHAIKVQRDLTAHRDLFLKHYSVMRDVRAICGGFAELQGKTTTSYRLFDNSSSSTMSAALRQSARDHQGQATKLQKEMALVDFAKDGRKFAPTAQDACVALLEWSPKRILVGYARECSLRLFEAVSSNNNSNNNSCGPASAGPGNIRCKELVYQSVDPFACTKKRKCSLKAVALDEERIGCLCSAISVDTTSGLRPVQQRPQNEDAFLVVVNRDDFLLGESSAVITKGGSKQQHAAGQVENLKVIDIGQAVLNYILTASDDDHHHRQLLPLLHFLADGGHVDDVIVQASWSLVACGYGRFLVLASISIRHGAEDFDEDGPPGLIQYVDSVLVLFSSEGAGSIAWMGSSQPIGDDLGNAVLASTPLYQQQLPKTPQNQAMPVIHPGMCTIAVRSDLGSSILVLDIDTCSASGQFGSTYDTHVIPNSTLIRDEILTRQRLAEENRAVAGARGEQVWWRYHLSRQLLVTSTDILAADCLQSHAQATTRLRQRKAILTFYPRYPSMGQSSCETLTLPGMLCVEEMVTVRDDHVVAICSELHRLPSEYDNRRGIRRRQQGQEERVLVSDDDDADEQEEDNIGNEDADGGGDGLDDDRRILPVNAIDNNNNGNDDDNGSDTASLEEEYLGQSLVVVVIHVPSRCEIGRVLLQSMTLCGRMVDGCFGRPKMSSTMGQGGTIALALDAAGIILTGEAVRSAAGECNQHNSGGTTVADEARSPGAGSKKKKKKVRRSAGGKKDGFARGMTLRG